MLDVPRPEALAGQHRRGRVLRAGSFDRHWRRWQAQRPALVAAARAGRPCGSFSRVYVADRASGYAVLGSLVIDPVARP
jgi:hypothetical protein